MRLQKKGRPAFVGMDGWMEDVPAAFNCGVTKFLTHPKGERHSTTTKAF